MQRAESPSSPSDEAKKKQPYRLFPAVEGTSDESSAHEEDYFTTPPLPRRRSSLDDLHSDHDDSRHVRSASKLSRHSISGSTVRSAGQGSELDSPTVPSRFTFKSEFTTLSDESKHARSNSAPSEAKRESADSTPTQTGRPVRPPLLTKESLPPHPSTILRDRPATQDGPIQASKTTGRSSPKPNLRVDVNKSKGKTASGSDDDRPPPPPPKDSPKEKSKSLAPKSMKSMKSLKSRSSSISRASIHEPTPALVLSSVALKPTYVTHGSSVSIPKSIHVDPKSQSSENLLHVATDSWKISRKPVGKKNSPTESLSNAGGETSTKKTTGSGFKGPVKPAATSSSPSDTQSKPSSGFKGPAKPENARSANPSNAPTVAKRPHGPGFKGPVKPAAPTQNGTLSDGLAGSRFDRPISPSANRKVSQGSRPASPMNHNGKPMRQPRPMSPADFGVRSRSDSRPMSPSGPELRPRHDTRPTSPLSGDVRSRADGRQRSQWERDLMSNTDRRPTSPSAGEPRSKFASQDRERANKAVAGARPMSPLAEEVRNSQSSNRPMSPAKIVKQEAHMVSPLKDEFGLKKDTTPVSPLPVETKPKQETRSSPLKEVTDAREKAQKARLDPRPITPATSKGDLKAAAKGNESSDDDLPPPPPMKDYPPTPKSGQFPKTAKTEERPTTPYEDAREEVESPRETLRFDLPRPFSPLGGDYEDRPHTHQGHPSAPPLSPSSKTQRWDKRPSSSHGPQYFCHQILSVFPQRNQRASGSLQHRRSFRGSLRRAVTPDPEDGPPTRVMSPDPTLDRNSQWDKLRRKSSWKEPGRVLYWGKKGKARFSGRPMTPDISVRPPSEQLLEERARNIPGSSGDERPFSPNSSSPNNKHTLPKNVAKSTEDLAKMAKDAEQPVKVNKKPSRQSEMAPEVVDEEWTRQLAVHEPPSRLGFTPPTSRPGTPKIPGTSLTSASKESLTLRNQTSDLSVLRQTKASFEPVEDDCAVKPTDSKFTTPQLRTQTPKSSAEQLKPSADRSTTPTEQAKSPTTRTDSPLNQEQPRSGSRVENRLSKEATDAAASLRARMRNLDLPSRPETPENAAYAAYGAYAAYAAQKDNSPPPLREMTRSATPTGPESLEELSRQSDSLYERYASLRSARQKLSNEIVESLKNPGTGPDFASSLLDQHLALNSINSSMNICFAKLKSLDYRKEEATTNQLTAMAAKLRSSNDMSGRLPSLRSSRSFRLTSDSNLSALSEKSERTARRSVSDASLWRLSKDASKMGLGIKDISSLKPIEAVEESESNSSSKESVRARAREAVEERRLKAANKEAEAAQVTDVPETVPAKVSRKPAPTSQPTVASGSNTEDDKNEDRPTRSNTTIRADIPKGGLKGRKDSARSQTRKIATERISNESIVNDPPAEHPSALNITAPSPVPTATDESEEETAKPKKIRIKSAKAASILARMGRPTYGRLSVTEITQQPPSSHPVEKPISEKPEKEKRKSTSSNRSRRKSKPNMSIQVPPLPSTGTLPAPSPEPKRPLPRPPGSRSRKNSTDSDASATTVVRDVRTPKRDTHPPLPTKTPPPPSIPIAGDGDESSDNGPPPPPPPKETSRPKSKAGASASVPRSVSRSHPKPSAPAEQSFPNPPAPSQSHQPSAPVPTRTRQKPTLPRLDLPSSSSRSTPIDDHEEATTPREKISQARTLKVVSKGSGKAVTIVADDDAFLDYYTQSESEDM